MPKSEPTAYAKHQKVVRKRQKERDRNQGARRQASAVGRCGAKRASGGTCGMPAGGGTEHYGFGRCRYHGGLSPSGVANSAKQQAVLMGSPVDINPLDALIWCIKITAGEIEFCSEQMKAIAEEHWVEQSIAGKQLHLWARERQKAVERLAKFSKDALSLGIAERAVRIAEQYGTSLARYTKGILEDLQLTSAQMALAPHVVRKHLAILEGSAPVNAEDRAAMPLPEIPGRVITPTKAIDK